ncbi:MAG: hypothetical protein CVV44_04065 [Spirochaetae bacterium HGW-Spirochaetae-1]|jgi:hypothetical protein|nr:MAG: hypothetical protein CVV44_04065 [Spirochaetae bacterium HGW-Spirochaetae-1]
MNSENFIQTLLKIESLCDDLTTAMIILALCYVILIIALLSCFSRGGRDYVITRDREGRILVLRTES